MRAWCGIGLLWACSGCGASASGEPEGFVDLEVPPPALPAGHEAAPPVPGSPTAVDATPGAGTSTDATPNAAVPDGAAASPSAPAPADDPALINPVTAGPVPADIVARAALPLHGLTALNALAEPELWAALAAVPVVCFGETHDNAAHHFAQQRAMQELALRAQSVQAPLGVGFEMFQTPFQGVVAEFAAGSIGEPELLVQSQYAARWGYDFAYYRPLLELVREYQLPALALNAPVELTSKIGDVGLAGLTPEERASLPELDLDDPTHRAYIYALLGAVHEGEPALENPYTVQVVWDETMADTASDWLANAGASARLLVIAGSGHCHHSAIPARITRRTGLPVLAVSPVLESQLGREGFPTLDLYDLLVVLEDTP